MIHDKDNTELFEHLNIFQEEFRDIWLIKINVNLLLWRIIKN